MRLHVSQAPPTAEPPDAPTALSLGTRLAWAACIAVLVLLICWPAVLAGGGGTSQSSDFREYHLLEIERIAHGSALPDWRGALTATTPGYHLVMAAFLRLGAHPDVLRMVASAFLAIAASGAWWFAAGWTRPARALLCIAPMALCPYLVGSGIWGTTESLALLLAVPLLGSALAGPRAARGIAVQSALTAAAAMVRQVLVWASVPAVVEALFPSPKVRRRSVATRLLRAASIVLPAFVLLALLFVEWGGPVPPRFQAFHQSHGNPAAAVFAFAALGAWAAPLLPALWTCSQRPIRRVAIASAATAALLCCTVETGYRKVLPPDSQNADTPFAGTRKPVPDSVVVGQHEVGRWGGPLWDAAAAAPEFGHRSMLLVPLAGIGVLELVLLIGAACAQGRSREAMLVVLAGAAMTASQVANAQTFERYFDPWILLFVGWLAAMGIAAPARPCRWTIRGLVAMGAIQAALTVRAVLWPAFTGPPM